MLQIVEKIAEISRNTTNDKGRECYALSAEEDQAIAIIETEARQIFIENNISEDEYEINYDAFGNIFITYFGKDRTKSVISGSHVDSVKDGGNFDGVAGVNSALNFLRKLVKLNEKSEFNYTAVAFRAEESSPKTGFSCLGSQIATGLITKEKLEKVTYSLGKDNVITLHEYFLMKFGEDEGEKRWQNVLKEIEDPPIKKSNTVVYEELHIEQSAVCEVQERDVGIVIEGIGGAIRHKVEVTLKGEYIHEADVENDTFTEYTLHFTGESAHTGGTPPNYIESYESGIQKEDLIYRKDALIAAAYLIKVLTGMFKKEFKVTSISVPELKGYTSVPDAQIVTIVVANEDTSEFEKLLDLICKNVNKQYAVEVAKKSAKLEKGEIKYYDKKALKSLDIPQFVELTIRYAVKAQIDHEGSTVGRVRGTTTDFRIEDDTLAFNLDYRDVDTQTITTISDNVTNHVSNTLEALTETRPIINEVSIKKYVPVDTACSEEKIAIADANEFTYALMPSLPGHDAASLGATKIPVSVTFVRHNGDSHTHKETMPTTYYAKAEQLSHTFLLQKLGIENI